MTQNQLINEISNELTESCALPYSLPTPEIKRIIERAQAWAWDNYYNSLEERLVVIPNDVYYNPNFWQNNARQIQLPDCIQFVYELKEMTGVGIMGQPDRDFSDSKLLGAEIFLSPFQGDNLVYRTAMYSYFDLAMAYDLETIAHRWNKNTHRLSILGRTPVRDTYIRAGVRIPEESLYDDELFIRYCFAQAKINLGRILQIFNYNLPGGITINFDAIKQDGVAEMEAVKAQIDGESTPDWFLLWN